jgi:transcriptional repressor of cell division inhibition gene dicB
MSNPFERLIKHFGSQGKTAKALGVTQGSVSGWVRGLHGCSALVAMRAEIATKGEIKAHELCPDIPERNNPEYE